MDAMARGVVEHLSRRRPADADAETRVVRGATEAIVASAAMLNYTRGSKGYDTLVRRSMDIPARA